MEFKVNCGIWGSMFGVPDVVADNFLKLASGNQIKVLLYLLRGSGRTCSDEEISMNTGVSVQEVADAVIFWQQANVLSNQNVSTISSIMTSPQSISPVSQTESAPVQQAVVPDETVIEKNDAAQQIKPDKKAPRSKTLSPSEIAEKIRSNPEINDLFAMTQSILGLINNTYQSSLVWMYEYLGMKIEVIITLITCCKEIEKTDPRYIEKIALDWNESEINDMESAQIEAERIRNSRSYIGNVMRICGMHRKPTTKQTEFIEDWHIKNISFELIHRAYEITIERTDKLSFDYLNKILISWHKAGYKTVDDVNEAEMKYRKKKEESNNNEDDSSEYDVYDLVVNRFKGASE